MVRHWIKKIAATPFSTKPLVTTTKAAASAATATAKEQQSLADSMVTSHRGTDLQPKTADTTSSVNPQAMADTPTTAVGLMGAIRFSDDFSDKDAPQPVSALNSAAAPHIDAAAPDASAFHPSRAQHSHQHSRKHSHVIHSRETIDPALQMETVTVTSSSDAVATDMLTANAFMSATGSPMDRKPHPNIQPQRAWLGRALLSGLAIAVLLQWAMFCQSLWQQSGVFAIVAVLLNIALLAGTSWVGIRFWQSRQQRRRLMTLRQQSLMLQQHQGYGQSQAWLRQLAQQLKRPNADLTGARPEWTDAEVVQIAASQWLGPIEWQVQQLTRRAAVEGALACSLSPVALLDILLMSWRANRLAVDIANAYGAELSWWQRGRLMKKFLQLLLWTAGSDLAFDAATELSSVELTAKISGRLSQGVLVGIWLHRFGRFCQQELKPIAIDSASPAALQQALTGYTPADTQPWWQDLFAQLKQRRASVRSD